MNDIIFMNSNTVSRMFEILKNNGIPSQKLLKFTYYIKENKHVDTVILFNSYFKSFANLIIY